MFCPRCGKPQAGAASQQHCIHCGAALPSVKAAVETTPNAEQTGALFAATDDTKPPTNVYAWGLVLLLGVELLWQAYAYVTAARDAFPYPVVSGSDGGFPVLLLFGGVGVLLVYRDMMRNDFELTPLRFLFGFVFPPVWLWIRGRPAHASRAPFWTYAVVLMLGLVGLSQVRMRADSWSTPMSSVDSTNVGSAAVQAAAPSSGSAQPSGAAPASATTTTDQTAASPWSVSIDVDKLTDLRTVRAVVTATVQDNSDLRYELTFRCDARTRVVTLATYEQSGLGNVPRILPFETRASEDSLIEFKDISFRMDDGPVQSATLIGGHGQEANAGTWGELTGDVPNVAARSDTQAALGRRPEDDLSKTMPTTRLVLADVFPTETVEFSFSSLTPNDRANIQAACFPPAVPEQRQ